MASLVRNQYLSLLFLTLSSVFILSGIWSKFKSTSFDVNTLPFKSFPLPAINSDAFFEKIGYPPIIKSKKERDFDVFLFLTTSAPEYNCVSCKNLNIELQKASSLFSAKYRMESKVHFVSMELKSNQELFMKLRVEHVPTILYLPAPTKVASRDYANHVKIFDIRRGFDMGLLLNFIRESSGKEPDVTTKRNGSNILSIIGFTLLFATIGFKYFDFRAKVVKLCQSWITWCLLSLFFVILMLSGHMWVRIRNAPIQAIDRNGRLLYISAGHQNQLGMETQILFALNLIASVATIIISKSENIKKPLIRKVVMWICVAAICLSFSIELNLFRQKIGGYPFHFLPISIF